MDRSGPGGACMSVRTRLSIELDAPCDVETAREHLSTEALKPGELGTVGLELERHVVDTAAPGSVVSWQRLESAIADVSLPRESALTLEPGGQLELSTLPASGVVDAVEALAADDA